MSTFSILLFDHVIWYGRLNPKNTKWCYLTHSLIRSKPKIATFFLYRITANKNDDLFHISIISFISKKTLYLFLSFWVITLCNSAFIFSELFFIAWIDKQTVWWNHETLVSIFFYMTSRKKQLHYMLILIIIVTKTDCHNCLYMSFMSNEQMCYLNFYTYSDGFSAARAFFKSGSYYHLNQRVTQLM